MFGSVTCSGDNSVGSSCVFVCDKGYKIMIEENSLDALSEELANTLYCLENLEWSSNEPICVVQECTPLQYDQVNLSNIMFQIVFEYKFSCFSKKILPIFFTSTS